uniref:Uncharacterized protein n=1 Tax=Anguilla anguilla TaxID=7936 RepID=A0A0E9RFG9_ANGAN
MMNNKLKLNKNQTHTGLITLKCHSSFTKVENGSI